MDSSPKPSTPVDGKYTVWPTELHCLGSSAADCDKRLYLADAPARISEASIALEDVLRTPAVRWRSVAARFLYNSKKQPLQARDENPALPSIYSHMSTQRYYNNNCLNDPLNSWH